MARWSSACWARPESVIPANAGIQGLLGGIDVAEIVDPDCVKITRRWIPAFAGMWKKMNRGLNGHFLFRQ